MRNDDRLLIGSPSFRIGAAPLKLGKRLGGQTSPQPPSSVYHPDARELFARFATDPGSERKDLISDRFEVGKQKPFWAKFDALWLHAAHGPEAGRLDWIDRAKDGRFNCQPINNPAFTVDRGYMGDGSSSYLDTGFNPALATGVNSSRDSASLGVRSNTDNAATGSLAGFFSGSGTTINPRDGSNRFQARVNQATAVQTATNSVPSSVGMFVVSRTGPAAADMRLYRDGAILAKNTAGSASVAPVNGNYRLGSINDSSLRACEFSMGFIASGLTAEDADDLFKWFEPYRIAVGVPA